MPACHAGERGSIPRRGGIKLPPHPKLGWSPIFAFSPSPCRWSLFLFYIIFKDNTTIIFKTIPRPDAGPAGRATKRGSPESAPTSVSLFLSLRWFIFNRTSTRVTSSRPTPVFQKNKQGTGQDFSDEDECFFFHVFHFDLHVYQTYPGDQGLWSDSGIWTSTCCSPSPVFSYTVFTGSVKENQTFVNHYSLFSVRSRKWLSSWVIQSTVVGPPWWTVVVCP